MPKQKTIYAGSFKPPHKGHLFLVKKMLNMTKKPLNKKDLPGIVYVFISKKEREPCNDLTGEISKKIWQEYVKLLPKKDQGRVRLVLSKITSPTQTAYGFIKNTAKKGDVYYLVKSAKNANNSRFASFKQIKTKGLEFNELVLPGFENLNSTDMRVALSEGRKSDFYKFLPKMSSVQKNKLWKELEKLCK